MTRSDSINELATALAAAQGAIQNAKKDSENPYFRSKYADLAAIWDACRQPLTKNGLSVSQSPTIEISGEAEIVTRTTRAGEERDAVRVITKLTVTTLLLHSSGQWLCDAMSAWLPTSDPQAIGSGTTYLRRYALAALVGVAPEDDDANSTISHDRDLRDDRPPARKPTPPAPAKKPPAATSPQHQRVKVLGIVQRPAAADGRVKFLISGDDQKIYGTFRLEHAEAAKTAQEAGLPIDITYVITDGARVIQALKEVEAV